MTALRNSGITRSYLTSLSSCNGTVQKTVCSHVNKPHTNPRMCYYENGFFQTSGQQRRTITLVSRLNKRKSCRAVLKRFRRVKGGYLKRWRSGMVHKQRKKSSWRKFRLRGSVLVKNKTQLKTLNKMMYKH